MFAPEQRWKWTAFVGLMPIRGGHSLYRYVFLIPGKQCNCRQLRSSSRPGAAATPTRQCQQHKNNLLRWLSCQRASTAHYVDNVDDEAGPWLPTLSNDDDNDGIGLPRSSADSALQLHLHLSSVCSASQLPGLPTHLTPLTNKERGKE